MPRPNTRHAAKPAGFFRDLGRAAPKPKPTAAAPKSKRKAAKRKPVVVPLAPASAPQRVSRSGRAIRGSYAPPPVRRTAAPRRRQAAVRTAAPRRRAALMPEDIAIPLMPSSRQAVLAPEPLARYPVIRRAAPVTPARRRQRPSTATQARQARNRLALQQRVARGTAQRKIVRKGELFTGVRLPRQLAGEAPRQHRKKPSRSSRPKRAQRQRPRPSYVPRVLSPGDPNYPIRQTLRPSRLTYRLVGEPRHCPHPHDVYVPEHCRNMPS